MLAAVDAAEVLACLDHPSRTPSAAPSANRSKRLSLPAWSRHTESIDSLQFVERSFRARVAATPKA